MDKFLNEKDLLPLQQEPVYDDDMAKTKDERLKEKDAEIKRLRKALELEKLRSHAYSTMIDLAEQTFNIPVRKKIWHQTVSLLREDGSGAALSTLCGLFGYSRQAYNKRDDKEGFAEDAIEPIIMEKAREYRKSNPGLGASKLHAILKRMFDDTGCFPGRDAFIEMLRKHGLMVRIKRRRRYKTTD